MDIPEHHVRTKSDEAFLNGGGLWKQELGDRVCDFLEEHLTLENGNRFTLIPYQRDFIESVYCWVNPDMTRRVKLAFLTVGRSNGKTELCAGLTLYHLLADGLLSPRCASCAVDIAQSGQIYDKVKWTIDNNPLFSGGNNPKNRMLFPKDSAKEIRYPAKNGLYKALSSDRGSGGKLGHKFTYVCFDEGAAWQSDHLWTNLQSSSDHCPQGLHTIISTAGWRRNGWFFKKYQHCKAVLKGDIIDVSLMPWIYEVENPDTVDLESDEVIRLANPAADLGPLRLIDFKARWERSKRDVSSRLEMLRLNYNSWTEGADGWLDVQKWDDSKGDFPDLTKAPCYIGLDAGFLQDIFSVCCIFPINNRFYIRSYNYVPSKAVERTDKPNLIPYESFKLDKSLNVIKGDSIGIESDIYPLLDRLIKEHDVKSITCDKWQTRQLTQYFGMRGTQCYEFSQTNKVYHDPCKELERALLDGRIVHDGNACLRWAVGNVQLDRDTGGYVKPVKPQGNDSAKIDPVVALVMGFSQAAQHGIKPQQKPEIYIW